jgi:hypothetical protein
MGEKVTGGNDIDGHPLGGFKRGDKWIFCGGD